MERRNDPLHDYVLELTGKDDPVVLFVPTATGDDASYIVTSTRPSTPGAAARDTSGCSIATSTTSAPSSSAPTSSTSVGNPANMLDVWRHQGVDELLHQALAGGAVLTGGSAGGLCWFEGGTTDSFGPTLQLLHEGLGMIKGSYCPHYDAEDQRRPLFHAALLDGSLEMGYASWNRVAIRFSADGDVVEAVSSEAGGRALKVYARDGEIVEEDIPDGRLLEELVRDPDGVHLSDRGPQRWPARSLRNGADDEQCRVEGRQDPATTPRHRVPVRRRQALRRGSRRLARVADLLLRVLLAVPAAGRVRHRRHLDVRRPAGDVATNPRSDVVEKVPFVTSELTAEVDEQVAALRGQTWVLVLFLIVTLWGGVGVVRVLQDTVNTIWGVPRYRRPRFVSKVARGLVIIALLGLGIIGTAVVAGIALAMDLPIIAAVSTAVANIVLAAAIAVAVYRLIISAPVRTAELLPPAPSSRASARTQSHSSAGCT